MSLHSIGHSHVYYESTAKSGRRLGRIAESLGLMQQSLDAGALACGIDMEPVIEEVQGALLHARPVEMLRVIDRQMQVLERRVLRGWGFGENYFHWFERGVSLCGRAGGRMWSSPRCCSIQIAAGRSMRAPAPRIAHPTIH